MRVEVSRSDRLDAQLHDNARFVSSFERSQDLWDEKTPEVLRTPFKPPRSVVSAPLLLLNRGSKYANSHKDEPCKRCILALLASSALV